MALAPGHEPSSDTVLRPRLTLASVLVYERADVASAWLLGFMLLFSPWAFGTTQSWSIGTMNVCGYAVGLLLGVKLWIRWGLGHRPARWDTGDTGKEGRFRRALTIALAVLTGLLLGYSVLAALNARADYDPLRLTLSYREYLSWLPHSYDRAATWAVIVDYTAWAGAFWAMRDWLLGMTPEESRAAKAGGRLSAARFGIPARLRVLLWLLVINGAVLALEGIIQRLVGTGKLLFLVMPRIHQFADTQFGPFAYRSNGAQYLNLLWPVSLGFWWWLQRAAGRISSRGASRHWLLVCAAIMAAGPIISTSRAGALTAMLMLAVAVAVLISARHGDGLMKLGVLGVFGLGLGGGAYFGWNSLNPRLDQLTEGFDYRETMYDTARIIAREHPVFGTGPGTFEHMFQLYRQSLNEYWPAQLHNDWLEILLTFGWVGFGLVMLALASTLMFGFAGGGIGASRRFVWMLWLALAGCFLQARWDYPFRIYSIVFLFLTLCVVLNTVTTVGRNR